ncbi:hypothetical protein AVEN_20543-1 [Araneus ventricosus]|uniref:Uncharacterized protein n=1 Tax=Araneus ventricosus TaxID=182803 RepID=A0A4Y2W9S8_ARAVE|nr:hypothetical protein AVEN_20543-1 [Araneus ventricosus]
MENKLKDLESLPDLFRDTHNEIEFRPFHIKCSDNSFIQSLRLKERDQTSKKTRKIVANPMKWKCNAREIVHQTGTATEKRHFAINTTCRLLTAKPKRLRTEKRVEAEDDDLMGDENEANNEKNKRKIKSSRRKFSFQYSFL